MIYVLSGGGVDCIALLGAMRYLKQKPTHYVACSGGSVVSALLISGYTIDEILGIFSTDIFVNSIDIKKIDIHKALRDFGLWDTSTVFDNLEKLLVTKNCASMTLSQFYKHTTIDLTIVGSNVSTKKAVYFNHRTHGDMPLLTSLRISCNIPLLFQAVKFRDEYYVDGGLYDIFPYEYAKKNSSPDESVIGICVQSFKAPSPIENIRDFIYNFSLSMIETLTNNTHYSDDTNVYTIDTSGVGVDIVSFLDTKTERRKLILQYLLQEGSYQCERTHLKRSLSDE